MRFRNCECETCEFQKGQELDALEAIDGSLSHTASDYALGYEAGYRDGVVDRGRRFVGKAADTQ